MSERIAVMLDYCQSCRQPRLANEPYRCQTCGGLWLPAYALAYAVLAPGSRDEAIHRIGERRIESLRVAHWRSDQKGLVRETTFALSDDERLVLRLDEEAAALLAREGGKDAVPPAGGAA